jgi:hypothetical protein
MLIRARLQRIVLSTMSPALLGLVLVSTGCSSSPESASAKGPSRTKPLAELCSDLDKVWDADMAPFDSKVAPVEKQIVDMLTTGKGDARSLITKNRQLFVDESAAAKKANLDLGRATSPNVNPIEHDSYVAYYTGVSQRAGARGLECDAILAYEAKPSRANLLALLDAARDVKGKDVMYYEAKR